MGTNANELSTVLQIVRDVDSAIGATATLDWSALKNTPKLTLESGNAYVRPVINPIDSVRLSAGGVYAFERRSDLTFQIIVERGTGKTTRDSIADTIADSLHDVTVDGLSFGDPPPFIDSAHDDGAWLVSNLVARYTLRDVAGAAFVAGDNVHLHSQTAHGFTAPLAVYWSAEDTLAAASNDDAAKVAQAVVVSVPNANSLWYTSEGPVNFSHGLGSTGSIWLGTSGTVTTTEGGDVFKQRLGSVSGGSQLFVQIGAPEDAA